MTFFVVNKNSQEMRTLSEFGRRGFSSLPSHTKLEMPNLSPTMEKVNFISFISYRETSQSGSRRRVTPSSPVIFLLRSKPIRPLLTLKCRKKVILLSFYSQREPRM
jgi:hypothetical protein